MRREPKRHHFTHAAPPVVDLLGVEWCGQPGCGLPERNTVHDVPQRTDEEREADARRIGEHA